jgi:glycosyltransferase involved in cell wall biosynthesis
MPSPADPKVTVFMAVYNREKSVGASIDSVLAQTFADFELLVIDDGSSDQSVRVVEERRDPRIRLVRHERNQGIPKTRNHGLSLARGEYLAILDSDDVAFPRRLERQVAYLDAHPQIAAVGGFAKRVRPDGRPTSPALRPTRPRDIRARILFASCFKNPTMMARTAAMREIGYREQFVICQDIDMWGRMSAKYALANLPVYLIEYRLGGTSHQDDDLSASMKKQAAADQLRDLGVAFDRDDLERHYQLRNPKHFRFDDADIDWCEDWLLRLLAANVSNPCYPEPEFSRAAAERWARLGWLAARHGVSPLRFLRPQRLRGPLPGVVRGFARATAQRLTARLRGA